MAKKLLATAMAAVCMTAAVATTSFAASTMTAATGDYNSSTGVVTVTTTTTDVSSITILALKNTYVSGDPTNADIAYIDQKDGISTAADTQTTFTFTVDPATFDIDKVYVGGSGLSARTKVEFAAPGGEYLTEDDITVVTRPAAGQVYNQYATLYEVKPKQELEAGQMIKAYVDDVAAGSVFYSTERKLWVIGFATAPAGEVKFKAEAGTKDVDYAEFVYGDLSGDSKYTTTDLTFMKQQIGQKNLTRIATMKNAIAAEVSGDGKINTTDLTHFKQMSGQKRTTWNIQAND